MAKLNTIAIVHPESSVSRLTINEKDFDPTVHVLWVEPVAPPEISTGTIAPTALPELSETIAPDEPLEPGEPTGTIEPPGLLNAIPTIEDIEGMEWRAIKAYCESIGLQGKGDESWGQFLIQHLYPSI